MSEMALCDIHQQQTNMDKETQIQGVVDNVVIKNEEADECMLVLGEQTLLKQQTLDGDCLETCHNVYDSYFEVLNHELCVNNSEIKTFTDNQQESPQAAVNLSTEFTPTLGKPLTMMWTDETSSMGEVCFESKTQQSLQKAKDTDNHGLVCGEVNSRATRTHNKLFTCEHCDLQFYRSITLKVHMRIHNEEKPFTCNFCNYKCAAYSILMNHIMSAHTEKKLFTCKHCDFKCSQSTHLKVHLRTHTGEKHFTCNICNYTCIPKGSFMRHMQTHKEKPYSYKHCDVKCVRADALKVHMRIHNEEKPFTCNVCSYKCASYSLLMNHIMSAHTEKKLFTCKHCDFKCSQSTHLKVHVRTHTGEKHFTCNICNYTCVPKGSFMRHMQTHKEKPYICKHCDVKCARADTLKGHMRTHTGEKPFTCKYCDFKCSLSFNLKVHMRTHTGEKPYCCKHCDHKFSHSSNLQAHTRRIHEDSH